MQLSIGKKKINETNKPDGPTAIRCNFPLKKKKIMKQINLMDQQPSDATFYWKKKKTIIRIYGANNATEPSLC
jgi:hypothetical protein